MKRVLAAAVCYAGTVFAAGFLLGTIRVLWLERTTGALGAVALEVPVMLAISWGAAAWCARRLAVPARYPPRLGMGGLAFAGLMLAEASMVVLLFGQSPIVILAGWATPAGALGLAGQVAFAAMPALRLFAVRGAAP
jgi:hypothetical protein